MFTIGALDQMTWRTDERPPPRRRVRVRPVGVIGLVLLLAGLVLGGYIGWQFIGTNVVSHHRQSQLREQVRKDWAAGTSSGAQTDAGDKASAPHKATGGSATTEQDEKADKARRQAMLADAIALIRIPRFGDDYEMPVVAGVSESALASGVGWFDQTARPGQVGNFALAGHRITHGQPFSQFPELRKGDEVVVETQHDIYTYVLDDNGTDTEVDHTASWVLDPVPGHPDATPTKALITLTTCAELFHTDERSVVFGHLVHTEHKG